MKAIPTTYTKRISAYPSLPTTAEQGYPTMQIGHGRIAGAAGTPEPIIEQMNAALQAALKTPEVKDKLAKSGIETAEGSVADFVTFITAERKRLGELATKARMSAQQ